LQLVTFGGSADKGGFALKLELLLLLFMALKMQQYIQHYTNYIYPPGALSVQQCGVYSRALAAAAVSTDAALQEVRLQNTQQRQQQ
jgi:hypothetical protein